MGSFIRKRFPLQALAAGLLLGLAGQASQAQTFPAKPVRVFASSGGSEQFARVLTNKMGEIWGQGVVTEVRSGASGNIVLEALSASAPDGYTLATVTLGQMLSTLELQRNFVATEYAPVTFAGATPFAIAINAAIPAKNLDEWIAYVKAAPGKYAFASSGLYGSAHVCMEEFNRRAGIEMLHVPYKTSTAGLQAVVSGETQAYCAAAANALALAKAGKIRLVGSTYKKPSELVPDVPPIANKLPGFEVLGWYGIIAPLKTDRNLVNRISADMVKALKSKDVLDIYNKLGIEIDGSSPEQFAVFLKEETEKWQRVFKNAPAKQ